MSRMLSVTGKVDITYCNTAYLKQLANCADECAKLYDYAREIGCERVDHDGILCNKEQYDLLLKYWESRS